MCNVLTPVSFVMAALLKKLSDWRWWFMRASAFKAKFFHYCAIICIWWEKEAPVYLVSAIKSPVEHQIVLNGRCFNNWFHSFLFIWFNFNFVFHVVECVQANHQRPSPPIPTGTSTTVTFQRYLINHFLNAFTLNVIINHSITSDCDLWCVKSRVMF